MTTTEAGLPPASTDPIRRAVMVQRWVDLVFLHWPYEVETVQRLLAPGVRVDAHAGAAWVGLIPFRMEGLGLPRLAPLPLVGAFPEVNVRTYVHAGDRRGVWFFSLDIDRLLPTVTARVAYHLPYCSGHAEHHRHDDRITTSVQRRWPRGPHAATEIAVTTTDERDDSPLGRFLTDRWRLISSTRRGGLRSAEVEHPPWDRYRARVDHLDDSLVAAAGLPAPVGDPHALWSPGVPVRVGRPRRIRDVAR